MPASMTIKEHKRPLDEMAYGRKDIKIEARGQFTNMQLQNKSFLKRIQNLCRLEHISLDAEEYEACFKAELPKLVDVMASGDYDRVCDYVFTLAKSSES